MHFRGIGLYIAAKRGDIRNFEEENATKGQGKRKKRRRHVLTLARMVVLEWNQPLILLAGG